MGYGNAGKVFLLFDKPFWNIDDKKTMHFAFIWNDKDRKAISKDVSFSQYCIFGRRDERVKLKISLYFFSTRTCLKT